MANFYEIELKSVLSEDKYSQLMRDAPGKMKLVQKVLVHNMLFGPGHHALKMNGADDLEYVVKKSCGLMCNDVYREKITQAGYTELVQQLNREKIKVREWGAGKFIFEHPLDDHVYKVYIEAILVPGIYVPAAYVLKARHESGSMGIDEHVLKLRRIMVSLGVTPVPARQFDEKLKSSIINRK